MKKIMMVILGGLLLLVSPHFAVPQSAVVSASSVQVVSSAPDISTDLKLQQQKLEFFKERLDLQDKRIGDLTFYLSLSLACFGVLMTVIVVFFSIRSTKEAVQAAKDEARKEVEAQAKIIIESWLGKDGQHLLVQKVEDTLRPEITKALGEIHSAAEGVLGEFKNVLSSAHDHNAEQKRLNEKHAKFLEDISIRTVDKDKPLSEELRKTVDEAAKELDSKAPKEYSADDWFMLGVQAFQSEKYEIAADHFSNAVDTATNSLHQAVALVNKGITLGALKRSEEVIAVCDNVVQRYGEVTELALREQVAKALVNKGVALGLLGRSAEVIAVYDEVVRRYGEAMELALRELVAKALVNKGVALGVLERNAEVIAVYDEVLRRYGEATELALRELVGMALVSKGFRLGKLDRSEEAIAVYDEVVRRYGDAPELALREQVAVALNGIGFALLCRAKKVWKDENEAAAKALLAQALEKIEAALKHKPDDPIYLGNQGYILFLLERHEEARPILTQAITLGGEKVLQAELADADIHSLPQDEAFRALVMGIK